jgi:predicted XRE-type DNA-binding protein
MRSETFANVFDALADSPAEAANLAARAELMLAIQRRVESWGLTQEEAAARLGVTRPRLSDLMRRKLHKFSLDALVKLATAAGLKLRIEVASAA